MSMGKPAVPELIKLLANDDAQVRWYAIDALGRIGTAASEAVPALKEAAEDEDESVRKNAAWALFQIEP
ncbi:MAG: HEAT repeat domain-containing protein [Planctomycetes bacterium]|nr:HEAT repeat domain-containing protein [Planctomycetota bacterium]